MYGCSLEISWAELEQQRVLLQVFLNKSFGLDAPNQFLAGPAFQGRRN